MSGYKVGDLILDELDMKGRLRADGAFLKADEYPELAALFETVEDDRAWPRVHSGPASHTMPGGNVKFSPDGSLLFIATETIESKLLVYSTDTWTEIIGASDNLDYAYWVDVSPDGRYLAVLELAARIKIVDTEDWSAIDVTSSISNSAHTCAFSPDGRYLAVGVSEAAGGLVVLNTTDWSVVPGVPVFDNDVRAIAFSPDSEHMVAYARSSSNFEVLSTASWTRLQYLPYPPVPYAAKKLSFSPCGAFLAVLTYASPYLAVFNTSDWSLVPGMPAPRRTCYAASFSADSKYLAVVPSTLDKLVVIETSTWTTVSKTIGGFASGDGRACDFSPDGKYLAVAHTTAPSLSVFHTRLGPYPEYFTIPDVPVNPLFPSIHVLIQAEKED